MLFQWMYSTSINFWKQHSLKLNVFALWHGNVLSSTECILRILCIILNSIAFQSYVWIWGSFASFFFFLNFIHSILIGLFHTFCVYNTKSCALWHWYWYILIICSFMNQNADCLFKEKNERSASKCLYVRSYIRTTVFWML